jgi:hypothetical protein
MRSLRVALVLSVAIGYSLVSIGQHEAYACSCAQLQTDADFERIIDAYDLVLVGSIAPPEPESAHPDKVHIAVEKVYKGPSVLEIALDQSVDSLSGRETTQLPPTEQQVEVLGPDCSYTLLGQPGERYLLFLKSRPSGTYEPGGCSSNSFHSGRAEEWLEPLDRLTAGGVLPAAPPGVGKGDPATVSSAWLVPLLMAAGAAAGAAGLLLLTAGRRRARP